MKWTQINESMNASRSQDLSLESDMSELDASLAISEAISFAAEGKYIAEGLFKDILSFNKKAEEREYSTMEYISEAFSVSGVFKKIVDFMVKIWNSIVNFFKGLFSGKSSTGGGGRSLSSAELATAKKELTEAADELNESIGSNHPKVKIDDTIEPKEKDNVENLKKMKSKKTFASIIKKTSDISQIHAQLNLIYTKLTDKHGVLIKDPGEGERIEYKDISLPKIKRPSIESLEVLISVLLAVSGGDSKSGIQKKHEFMKKNNRYEHSDDSSDYDEVLSSEEMSEFQKSVESMNINQLRRITILMENMFKKKDFKNINMLSKVLNKYNPRTFSMMLTKIIPLIEDFVNKESSKDPNMSMFRKSIDIGPYIKTLENKTNDEFIEGVSKFLNNTRDIYVNTTSMKSFVMEFGGALGLSVELLSGMSESAIDVAKRAEELAGYVNRLKVVVDKVSEDNSGVDENVVREYNTVNSKMIQIQSDMQRLVISVMNTCIAVSNRVLSDVASGLDAYSEAVSKGVVLVVKNK